MTIAFNFTYPVWQKLEPSLWLKFWASLYESNDSRKEDNRVYKDVIDKDGKLSAEDFETVGRWKEGCLAENHGSWKPNTPAAYEVWMQAKSERPTCPTDTSISTFLTNWSERKFIAGVDKEDGQALEKRFGLSRSTTLLHFISVARFPIFDSRVGAAIKRLGVSPPAEPTADWYMNTFCPLFKDIASLCGVSDKKGFRLLDNALFCYGGTAISFAAIDTAMLLSK